MLSDKYKNILITIIRKYLPECKIYLFGSRATGDQTKYSDVDIAIDSGEVLDLNIIGKIKSEIEESKIPFFVDLVDLNNVDNRMRDQILKYGVLWKN